jgi:hypothetical protein
MKSMFAIGFVFTALLSMFNTMYVFFIVHRRLCMILSETFIGKRSQDHSNTMCVIQI